MVVNSLYNLSKVRPFRIKLSDYIFLFNYKKGKAIYSMKEIILQLRFNPKFFKSKQ